MTSVFNEYEGVAIVVPTLNEEKSIELCLRSLLLVPASYPVIVADGGSSDATRAVVERLMLSEPRLRLIDNPRLTQACAVNLVAGDLPATYRWLVRADAHSLYPPDYVASLLSACVDASSSSVVVRMRAVGRGWFERAAACAQNSALGNGGARHRNQTGGGSYVDHGHHALFDLDVFRAVGGYDESFTHNEDFELDHRIRQAGGSIWLTGSTQIEYYPRSSLLALARQYYRHGRGRARSIAKHRIAPKVRQCIPVGVLGAYVVGLVSAPFNPMLMIVPATHFGLCFFWGAALSYRRGDLSALASGPLAVTMHLAWASGLCHGLFKHLTYVPNWWAGSVKIQQGSGREA